ncbi:N-acetylmuramoyl-L-alanine amidase [Lysobacter sp. Root667]|uniref:N-acetylmuramoyl-L-alanine amidase n=1 Tax=Lysobacter sp. Root667 TaxID=1736581 RepID=UPI0006F235B3|nr:N-acetylmuramoyl-L-alanine amidase [Lysobacter sp. Root667]KRA72953.1 N-acetylmuramoyl-L-alanine amidase [Lysobacter sp. Root667]
MPPLPTLRVEPLPYEALLEARGVETVDLVVIHCTELPDLATAREYGERVLYPASGTGNSGHYYLDRDGSVHRYVEPLRSAHHTRGYNLRSVGIELVNTGRYPNWLDSRHQAMDEAYTPAQIDALIALLADLRAQLPALRWIAGHEDLDTSRVEASDDPAVLVQRKRDPGPQFPWARVLDACGLERLPAQSGSEAGAA